MIACPYCFNQLRLSEAMTQLIGKTEIVIQCSSCQQRLIYKKVIEAKTRVKQETS